MKAVFKSELPVFLLAVMGVLVTFSAQARNINLAVANSTCSAIKQVGKLYQSNNNVNISYLCKSSGRLAKGLNGHTITADIYISANRKWMDYMLKRKLIQSDNVSSPWGNELVVATSRNSKLVINKWQDIADDKVNTLLIGDPGTAPFGRYTKEALQTTKLWEKVKSKIETKKHITLLGDVLANSDSGTIGILFGSNTTDAHKVLFSVNPEWHSAIHYYIGPLSNSARDKDVLKLLAFIKGKDARKIFREQGFKTR